jgi:cytochrome c
VFERKATVKTAKQLSSAILIAGTLLLAPIGTVRAADEAAARGLARQSNCFKCHSVEKKKEGPAWRDVAAKYRGNPDAEAKLIKHVTSGEKVKFEDGHEEDHAIVKSTDPKEIKNLVDWILSLQ